MATMFELVKMCSNNRIQSECLIIQIWIHFNFWIIQTQLYECIQWTIWINTVFVGNDVVYGMCNEFSDDEQNIHTIKTLHI